MPMYVSLIFHYWMTRGTIARSVRTLTFEMDSMIGQPLLESWLHSPSRSIKANLICKLMMVCTDFCSENLFYRRVLQPVCSQYELPQNSAPNTESSCLPAFEFVSGRFFQNDVSKILLHKRVSMVHHLLLHRNLLILRTLITIKMIRWTNICPYYHSRFLEELLSTCSNNHVIQWSWHRSPLQRIYSRIWWDAESSYDSFWERGIHGIENLRCESLTTNVQDEQKEPRLNSLDLASCVSLTTLSIGSSQSESVGKSRYHIYKNKVRNHYLFPCYIVIIPDQPPRLADLHKGFTDYWQGSPHIVLWSTKQPQTQTCTNVYSFFGHCPTSQLSNRSETAFIW